MTQKEIYNNIRKETGLNLTDEDIKSGIQVATACNESLYYVLLKIDAIKRLDNTQIEIEALNSLCHRSEKSINKSHKHENRRNIEQSKRCYKQFRNQKYFRK